MELNSKLCLSLHGELYVVDLSDIMCFEADDHYTHVFTSRGNSFMVPFSLARIEDKIKLKHCGKKNLLRLGRRYIININSIYHVNAVKQTVSLADNHGKVMTLSLSKTVLRMLMDMIKANDEGVVEHDPEQGVDGDIF